MHISIYPYPTWSLQILLSPDIRSAPGQGENKNCLLMVEISSVGIQKNTRDIPKSGSREEMANSSVCWLTWPFFMAVSRLESLVNQ